MKLKKLNNEINYKDLIVKAKIFNIKGSSPNNIDDLILISNDTIFGTIGGGNLEYLIVKEAKKLIDNKVNKKSLNIALGPDIGQCCGGYVQIKLSLHKNSLEALKNEKLYDDKNTNLYIFGAGHIGQALISKLENINFNTFLIDSRENFLKMTNINNINYLLSKKPWEIVNRLKDNSYFVVLTHSHDYDLKVINEVLKKNFTFLGLIGSKTKKNRFFKRLIDNGHNKSLVETIECPIGINIGNSKDPDEIAFSIITRLITIKNNLKIIKNKKIKEVI
jgi:xanthine dehydrogenase accessory factor